MQEWDYVYQLMKMPGRYVCRDEFSPVWRQLDEEFVIFDRNSGNIFCFDAGTAYLIQLLCEESLQCSEIEERLAERFEVESEQVVVDFVRRALQELVQREIVRLLLPSRC